MKLTVELPDHVIAELLRNEDSVEAAVRDAVLLCHEMDIPPEVREYVDEKYDFDGENLTAHPA